MSSMKITWDISSKRCGPLGVWCRKKPTYQTNVGRTCVCFQEGRKILESEKKKKGEINWKLQEVEQKKEEVENILWASHPEYDKSNFQLQQLMSHQLPKYTNFLLTRMGQTCVILLRFAWSNEYLIHVILPQNIEKKVV